MSRYKITFKFDSELDRAALSDMLKLVFPNWDEVEVEQEGLIKSLLSDEEDSQEVMEESKNL